MAGVHAEIFDQSLYGCSLPFKGSTPVQRQNMEQFCPFAAPFNDV